MGKGLRDRGQRTGDLREGTSWLRDKMKNNLTEAQISGYGGKQWMAHSEIEI